MPNPIQTPDYEKSK